MEEHKLKTIKDIIEVVNEDNFKTFKVDFENWLGLQVMLKMTNRVAGDIIRVETDSVFKWIDDGKNDINIKIQVKEKL